MKVTRKISVSKLNNSNQLKIHMSGDYIDGEVVRAEGSKSMRLENNEIVFQSDHQDISEIHNDIIALLFVLSFYPAFPSENFIIDFDFPVSENIQKALRRPYILPNVTITSPSVGDPYTPKKRSVLSYGGGFDSLAAHLLFPDIPLVHETPIGDYKDAVNEIMPKLSSQAWIVRDNMRTLFSVWGLPLWMSVFASSLLFSPRYIISGSEMTGTYLNGGRGYFPRHRNRWYEVFRAVGIDILPTSFLSEIGNAHIVHKHGKTENAAYCSIIRNQDCRSCTKCLRRRAIREVFNKSDRHLVDDFERTEAIDNFLATRPLYYGDIFIHAINKSGRSSWLKKRLKDLTSMNKNLSFHDRYYPDVFEHFRFPEDLASRAKDGMRQAGIMPFGDGDLEAFQNYEQRY